MNSLQKFVITSRCLAPAILLIGGCTFGPDYAKPDNHALTAINYIGAGNAPDQNVRTKNVTTKWWESYNDPVLNSWVADLTSGNLNLKAAAERVIQAQHLVSIRRGALWPTLGLTNDVVRAFVPGPANDSQRSYGTDIEVGAGISWQLDLFGRTRHAVASAEYDALANASDYRALAQSLVAELVNRRVTLLLLGKEIEIQQNIVKSREQTLNTVTRRHRLGVQTTSAVDVHTARENVSSATAQLFLLLQQRRETMLLVDTLLNQPPGTLRSLNSPFPPLPPAKIPNIDRPADLLDHRPDIISSELRLKATYAGISVAVADLFPDLTISATRGFSSDQVSGLLQNNNAIGVIASKITARLFEGGRLREQIRLRESQTRELAWQYANIVLTAMGEVETALVQEQFLREQVAQLEVSVHAVRQAETLAQQRYLRGITPLLEVLETQRRLQNAERNLLSAQRASWVARINLHLALGGDWFGELIESG
jgi:NodT family efflux transporter outer membrane factor (OMF) lipoprotein